MGRKIHSIWVVTTCGVMLGCSAASSRSVPLGGCKVNNPSSKAGTPTNFNLLSLASSELSNPQDPALGIAYLDFNTKSADGTPVKRRCTATFRKHSDPAKAGMFEMYTAKHCTFPPESPEFANATTKLQIWANGGYFPIDVSLEAKKDFAVFAQSNISLLAAIGGLRGLSKWTIETQTGGMDRCKTNSIDLMNELGNSEGSPRVACVSEDDLVLINVTVSVPPQYQSLFEKITNALDAREKAIDKLSARDQRLIGFYKKLDNINSQIGHGLRQFAYTLNQNFCNAPDGDPVTFRKTDLPITKSTCERRLEFIELLKVQLPQQYDTYMKEIAEQPLEQQPYAPTSGIVKLHDRLFGCRVTSLDNLDLDNLSNMDSECDINKFKKLMWQRWVHNHEQRLSEISGTPAANSFGFNPATYFSIRVNSFTTQAALDANDVSKSKANMFTLSKGSRRFVTDEYDKIAAFSFIPSTEKMFMTKKDSGSLFYILGSIPFAALSTIDGEATSGGASITPLPEAGSEEGDSSKAGAGGC